MLGSAMPGTRWQAFPKATEQRRGKIRLCGLWQLAVERMWADWKGKGSYRGE